MEVEDEVKVALPSKYQLGASMPSGCSIKFDSTTLCLAPSPPPSCIDLPDDSLSGAQNAWTPIWSYIQLGVAGFDTSYEGYWMRLSTTVTSTCAASKTFSFSGDGGYHFLDVPASTTVDLVVTDKIKLVPSGTGKKYQIRESRCAAISCADATMSAVSPFVL